MHVGGVVRRSPQDAAHPRGLGQQRHRHVGAELHCFGVVRVRPEHVAKQVFGGQVLSTARVEERDHAIGVVLLRSVGVELPNGRVGLAAEGGSSLGERACVALVEPQQVAPQHRQLGAGPRLRDGVALPLPQRHGRQWQPEHPAVGPLCDPAVHVEGSDRRRNDERRTNT